MQFPGMDPYLEDTFIWTGFHHSLAEEIKAQLNAQIGPKYFADVEIHTVFEDVGITTAKPVYPDVGVFEPKAPGRGANAQAARNAAPVAPLTPAPIFRVIADEQTKLRTVQVYVTATQELVTSVEILSPYNKRGEGLAEYRRKRSYTLNSPVHLVEIDLLRAGQRPGRELNVPPLEKTDYVFVVNRSQDRNRQRVSEIWPVALNEALPILPTPLLFPDPDARLDLNVAIQSIYARSGYAWRIDYTQSVPPPKLRPAMATWLRRMTID